MGLEIAISVGLLLVGIAILVCIHMWIVGRAFGRREQAGETEEEDAERRRRRRMMMISSRVKKMMMMSLSMEEIKALPSFDYKGGREGGVECVVCLEDVRVGERCKVLPNCRHTFHSLCIDSWLINTPICPLCRTCVHLQKLAPVLNLHQIATLS